MSTIKEAVILAAGEGQRLRPLTSLKPKVMIQVANKPILQYVIEALRDSGIRRIVIVVGYHKGRVQDYFGSGESFGVSIEYAVQTQQIGTANALKQAKNLLGDRFLVLPGDNIIEPDTIAPILNGNENNIVLVKKQPFVSKYGIVIPDKDRVHEIIEKPSSELGNLVNTGIYRLNKTIFDYIGDETDITSVLQVMINSHHHLFFRETEANWLDAVYPWDILKLNEIALSRITPSLAEIIEPNCYIKGTVSIGAGTIIHANSYILGPVIIGENCEIGPSVVILYPTSIGNNTVISPFTSIKNCSIGDNTVVGYRCNLEDSVIGSDCSIGNNLITRSGEATIKLEDEFHTVHIGALIGEFCQIEDNVITEPGVSLGPYSSIKSMKVINRNIPEKGIVI